MEGFFVVLALAVLAFPIIAIVALVKSVGASDRLRRIEIRLSELEHRPPRGGGLGGPTLAARRGVVPCRAGHSGGAGRAASYRSISVTGARAWRQPRSATRGGRHPLA